MTITWTINNLERQASDGLVTVIHFGVTATDGDFSASIVNTLQVERSGDFTAFDSLTQEQVIGWVQDAVGKDVVEAALEAQIEAKKAPVVLSGLPWVQGE